MPRNGIGSQSSVATAHGTSGIRHGGLMNLPWHSGCFERHAMSTPAFGLRAPGPRQRLHGQTGSTLIVVTLILAAIIVLSVYGARSAQMELRVAHNDVLGKQAMNAAEAGVNHVR